MAIDKSKENSRIQDLLDMGLDAVKIKTMVGIDNPSILKQFMTEEEMNWDYAVAAGLLEESDVQWIKEHVNTDEDEEGEANPK
jgi:hypothetical protein